MKKTFIIFLGLCLSFQLLWSQQHEGIHFEDCSWEEVLQKAQLEKKNIFVDVWASWCGPCKRLSREVFVLPEVGKFFNANFICYKLQTDHPDSLLRVQARQLSNMYEISMLPTLLWLSPQGELMHRASGYMKETLLLEEANRINDQDLSTASILKRWVEGDHSLKNGLVYFDIKKDSIDQFDEFYLQLSLEDKLNDDLQSLMCYSMSFPYQSHTLQYVAQHRTQYFVTDSTGYYWDRFIQDNLEDSFRYASSEDEKDNICTIYQQYDLPYLNVCRDKADCHRLLKEKDYENFFTKLGEMVANYDNKYFMHAIILNIGYSLLDNNWEDATLHPEFTQWVDQFIVNRNPREHFAIQYRLIAASVNKDYDEALKQQALYIAALDKSNDNKDYIKSKKADSIQLVEASKR